MVYGNLMIRVRQFSVITFSNGLEMTPLKLAISYSKNELLPFIFNFLIASFDVCNGQVVSFLALFHVSRHT